MSVDGSAKPQRGSGGALRRPGPGAVLRLTAAGRRAREVWAPLPALIEDRWRERYGASLRDALERAVQQLDPSLPDCLPILGHGMFSRLLDPPPPAPPGRPLPLPALLSRVLLAIAVEFERDSSLSLATSANVLRPLTAEGIRLRDLPRLSGISKEAIAMAMGVLETAGLAVTVPAPAGGRGKIAQLTRRERRRSRPSPGAWPPANAGPHSGMSSPGCRWPLPSPTRMAGARRCAARMCCPITRRSCTAAVTRTAASPLPPAPRGSARRT